MLDLVVRKVTARLQEVKAQFFTLKYLKWRLIIEDENPYCKNRQKGKISTFRALVMDS
jgi:hypothetical protein